MSMPGSHPPPVSSPFVTTPSLATGIRVPLGSIGTAIPTTYMRPPIPNEPRPTNPHGRPSAMTMLPQQPLPDEMQAVQEHLLQRPLNEADQAASDQFFEKLNVTFGDYAPGGENMPGDDAGKVHMI